MCNYLKQLLVSSMKIFQNFIQFNIVFYCLISFNVISIGFISSQSNLPCGVLPPNQATSTNPDSIVFDRFGNSYDAFPAWTSAVSLPCNQSGYYHLESTASLSTEMENALCLIFAEMSTIFPRRQNFNACGDPILQQPVNILIRTFNGAQSATAAASTLYFSSTQANCNSDGPIESGRIYHKINGGQEKRSNFLYDGLLDINTDLNWNLDFSTGPSPTQYDFRTVIKHEILHLMGIGTNLNMDGSSFNGYYSLYDKYLSVIPYFNSTGTINDLIASNCIANCYTFNSALFPGTSGFVNAVVDNCNSVPAGFDFVFKSPVVPISGGRGLTPGNDVDFVQMLSHFHESCNGINSNYIMQPVLAIGTRLEILPVELGVMCSLGYQTNGGCNGCYLVNYYEKDLENDLNVYSCCDNLYLTCKNREINVRFEDLLCNNAVNAIGSEITDVFIKNASIVINPDYANKEVKVTLLNEGRYEIYYTTTSCDCKMDNAVFYVFAGPCLNCNNSNSCTNLTKSNGFEELTLRSFNYHDFATIAELSNGVYWEFENSRTNTIDVCQEANGNKYIHMNFENSTSPPNKEGVCLYLCEGIAPNCTMKI